MVLHHDAVQLALGQQHHGAGDDAEHALADQQGHQRDGGEDGAGHERGGNVAITTRGAPALGVGADFDGRGLLPAGPAEAFAAGTHHHGLGFVFGLEVGQDVLLDLVGTEFTKEVATDRGPCVGLGAVVVLEPHHAADDDFLFGKGRRWLVRVGSEMVGGGFEFLVRRRGGHDDLLLDRGHGLGVGADDAGDVRLLIVLDERPPVARLRVRFVACGEQARLIRGGLADGRVTDLEVIEAHHFGRGVELGRIVGLVGADALDRVEDGGVVPLLIVVVVGRGRDGRGFVEHGGIVPGGLRGPRPGREGSWVRRADRHVLLAGRLAGAGRGRLVPIDVLDGREELVQVFEQIVAVALVVRH